ncbi:MAG: MBL fold metallo-hydrolase [Oscillospiraceae bacterium]|jgi:L-ascorbate metabolism protein UlaG (beta-lactamase superfamily)|nr:MBL fold metallo-hydrolase [Oscillospiraceae bacterium]
MQDFHITWLGQGGFQIKIEDKILYLDPYLSNMVEHSPEGLKRLVPPPITPAQAHPDYYLATHDHMDHLDTDFIKEMNPAGVRFICPPSCKDALRKLGCGITEAQITVVQRGDFLHLGAFTLRAVYADHTPDSVGFVLAAGGLTLYCTGDTLYGEGVGASVNADVITCCVNGKLGNMTAEEAVQVALRSGAKLALPNHYGMFAENTVDPADFTAPAQAAGLRTHTLRHGETINLKALL